MLTIIAKKVYIYRIKNILMETLLFFLLIIAAIALEFIALTDVVKSRFKEPLQQTIWFFVVLLVPVFGPVFYFQLRKKLTTTKKRVFNPEFNKA